MTEENDIVLYMFSIFSILVFSVFVKRRYKCSRLLAVSVNQIYINSAEWSLYIVILMCIPITLYTVFKYLSEKRKREKVLLDEKLPEAFDRLSKKLGTKEEVFFYKIQRTEYFIKVNRINYFQMQSHNVLMYLKDGVVEFREPMSKLMKRLPKVIFIKINKSSILNVLQIDEIKKLSVIMSNGKEIPGTAKSMKELRKLRLDSYLRSKR